MLKSITQKVKKWLNLLTFFNKAPPPTLPIKIHDDEKIVRTVFSPINVDKKNKLRTSVFKSPQGLDEVSVNRLDYTTPNFCKKLSKTIQSTNRTYFGLAVLYAKQIRNIKATVVYSPIKPANIFHADIKVGYIREKGKEAPAEINYKIKQLKDNARFYVDPNPVVEKWTGSDLI